VSTGIRALFLLVAWLIVEVIVGAATQVAIFLRLWPLLVINVAAEATLTEALKSFAKLVLAVPVYCKLVAWYSGVPFSIAQHWRDHGLLGGSGHWQLRGERQLRGDLVLACVFLFSAVRAGVYALHAIIAVALRGYRELITELGWLARLSELPSGGAVRELLGQAATRYAETLRAPPRLIGNRGIDIGVIDDPISIIALVVASGAVAFLLGIYGPARRQLVRALVLCVLGMALSQIAIGVSRAQLERPFARILEQELRAEVGSATMDRLLTMGSGTVIVLRQEAKLTVGFLGADADLSHLRGTDGELRPDVLFVYRSAGQQINTFVTNADRNDVAWKFSLVIDLHRQPPVPWLKRLPSDVLVNIGIFLTWTPLTLLVMAAGTGAGKRIGEGIVLQRQLDALPRETAAGLMRLIAAAAQRKVSDDAVKSRERTPP
jgi:hypothetical protein